MERSGERARPLERPFAFSLLALEVPSFLPALEIPFSSREAVEIAGRVVRLECAPHSKRKPCCQEGRAQAIWLAGPRPLGPGAHTRNELRSSICGQSNQSKQCQSKGTRKTAEWIRLPCSRRWGLDPKGRGHSAGGSP
eukprot:Amastigsp_a176247_33.p4 type:complete len:138 gc:universal Amastigsp_a176247_33:556-143(-)